MLVLFALEFKFFTDSWLTDNKRASTWQTDNPNKQAHWFNIYGAVHKSVRTKSCIMDPLIRTGSTTIVRADTS